MPEAKLAFHTPTDPARLRQLLSDPTFVAGCIPQVVAVERTSETTARWTVQIKIGPMTRKSVYEGELTESSESAVRFRATGPEAMIEGALGFAPNVAGGTDVGLTLTMKGSGPLRSVLDAYLAKRVREDAESFARTLASRVGHDATPTAGRPTRGV
jgi:carbon monoxide dehydrogenase subunit G